jgi:hypothetical protein
MTKSDESGIKHARVEATSRRFQALERGEDAASTAHGLRLMRIRRPKRDIGESDDIACHL